MSRLSRMRVNFIYGAACCCVVITSLPIKNYWTNMEEMSHSRRNISVYNGLERSFAFIVSSNPTMTTTLCQMQQVGCRKFDSQSSRHDNHFAWWYVRFSRVACKCLPHADQQYRKQTICLPVFSKKIHSTRLCGTLIFPKKDVVTIFSYSPEKMSVFLRNVTDSEPWQHGASGAVTISCDRTYWDFRFSIQARRCQGVGR